MASSTSTPPSPASSSPSLNTPQNNISSRLPNVAATISRIKSFRSTFTNSHRPPPVVFPPPTWDLQDDMVASDNATPEPLAATPDTSSVEPISFATKLKNMIEGLPTPFSTVMDSSKTQDTTDEKGDPSPVPSNLDHDMVRMLSSEEVMNGHSASRGSVWNLLANLKTGQKNKSSSSTLIEEEEHGLMMYSPLEPKADSQVELAKSEVIVEDVAQNPESDKPSGTSNAPVDIVEKRVWAPSTTELSVFTAWWGYRLYLPPAIMAKLNNKSLKATARAAMVAAALKWFLDKIPLAVIPPQLRPAVKLLKTLTPLTGYIGVFISWSWERIKSLDEGNGVVLSATWLLPVALIPMAWDAGEIFRPVAAPTPEELKAYEEEKAKAAEEARKAQTQDKKQDDGNQKKKSFFRW